MLRFPTLGYLRRQCANCCVVLVGVLASGTPGVRHLLAQTEMPTDANSVPAITRALQTRDFTAALEMSTRALRRSPQDPRLWTLQAIALNDLERPDQALASYQHAIHLAPEYLPALQGAGQIAYTAHRPEAETLLGRVLKQRPQDPTTHAMMGVLAFRRRDCVAAVEHFSRAEQPITNQIEALGEFSSCLVKLSRFEQAIPVFERILELEAERPANRYNLGLAEWNAGHPNEARAVLEPDLTGDHPAADELTLAAEIAEAQGDTQGALQLLRRAVVLDPKNKGAYLDFVNLAYQHASAQVGLDMVNLGIQQLPNEAELYLARGVLLCQLGKIDVAMVDFEAANRLNPKLSFLGVAEGIAHSQSHDAAGALARFRRQVHEHPDDALAHYLLAEALSELGKPENSPEFREEVAAARTAVRLDPGRVEAHDLLASAYLQTGDVTQSVAESRAALATDPNDQQALYHLVLALKRTEHREEIPGLLKRLMEAREQDQVQAQQNKRYRLVEAAGSETGPS